jgi:hypothetical protein
MESDNKPGPNDDGLPARNIALTAALITLVIVSLWFGSYLIIDRVFPDLQSAGFFGNSFGAIQALFSALALAGIGLAILIQNRELALQRMDLRTTREEISRQTEQFEGQKIQFESQKLQFELQNETLIQQRFENTFFHLMTLHHEIVGSIADRKTEKGEAVEMRGRAVFASAYIPLKDRYKGLRPESPETAEALTADIELIRKQFSWFFRRFGPYFTNFFSMLEFVDHNRVGYLEVKQFYVGLLRAQLSDYELMFIFYYAVTAPDKAHYTNLAEKYRLFADLDDKDLLDPAHVRFFGQEAFEETAPATSENDSTA